MHAWYTTVSVQRYTYNYYMDLSYPCVVSGETGQKPTRFVRNLIHTHTALIPFTWCRADMS